MLLRLGSSRECKPGYELGVREFESLRARSMISPPIDRLDLARAKLHGAWDAYDERDRS